jgi:hypothetical protein
VINSNLALNLAEKDENCRLRKDENRSKVSVVEYYGGI